MSENNTNTSTTYVNQYKTDALNIESRIARHLGMVVFHTRVDYPPKVVITTFPTYDGEWEIKAREHFWQSTLLRSTVEEVLWEDVNNE